MNHQSQHYFPKMTQTMRDASTNFTDQFEQELATCIQGLIEASSVDLTLPALTPEGQPVTHGARSVIYTLHDYWTYRLTLLVLNAGYDSREVEERLLQSEHECVRKFKLRRP